MDRIGTRTERSPGAAPAPTQSDPFRPITAQDGPFPSDIFARVVWPDPDATIFLATIPPPGELRFEAAPAREAAAFALAHPRENVHFTPAAFRDGADRRVRENVLGAACVWADCDRPADPGGLARLPPPSIEVESSPGRRHFYWRLVRFVAPDELAARLRGVARLLGSDRAVAVPNALLRLPGTANAKRGGCPVRLLAVRERALDPLDFPLSPCSRPGSASPRGAQADARARPPLSPPDADPPREVRLAGADAVLLWLGRAPSRWPDPRSASERDFALAVRLIRSGVPPCRVEDIVSRSPNRRLTGRWKADLDDYVSRTVRSASLILEEARCPSASL